MDVFLRILLDPNTIGGLFILVGSLWIAFAYLLCKPRDPNAPESPGAIMTRSNILIALAGAVFGVVIALLLLLWIPRSAAAHDAARPDLNEWFDRLSAGRGPCCEAHDGIVVADPDWDNSGNHYRVKLEGKWVVVPDDVVITKPNLDGRTMVWPMHIDGVLGIRCFMPGSMT